MDELYGTSHRGRSGIHYDTEFAGRQRYRQMTLFGESEYRRAPVTAYVPHNPKPRHAISRELFEAQRERVSGVIQGFKEAKSPTTSMAAQSILDMDIDDPWGYLEDRINALRVAAHGGPIELGDRRAVRRADATLHRMFGKSVGKRSVWSEIQGLSRRAKGHLTDASDFAADARSFDKLIEKGHTTMWSDTPFEWNARISGSKGGVFDPVGFNPNRPIEDIDGKIYGVKWKRARGMPVGYGVTAPKQYDLGFVSDLRRIRTFMGSPTGGVLFPDEAIDFDVDELTRNADQARERAHRVNGTGATRPRGSSIGERTAARATSHRVVTGVGQINNIGEDLTQRATKSVRGAYVTGDRVMGAIEYALDSLHDFDASEARRIIAGTFSRTASYVKEKGPYGMYDAARAAYKSFSQGKDGSLGSSDFEFFRNMVHNADGMPVSSGDMRIANALLKNITDHDQLFKIAVGVDRDAANAANALDSPIMREKQLKAIIANKMSKIPRQTFEESFASGAPASNVARLSRQKRLYVDSARSKLSKWLDLQMNQLNENLKTKVISDRSRRRIFGGQIRGLVQVQDIGHKNEGRRVFDWLGGYRFDQVYRGMDTVGEGNIVVPGVINAMGLTEHSAAALEAEEAFADGLFGFDIHSGRQFQYAVKQIATNGIDQSGRTPRPKLQNMVNLVFDMNEHEQAKMEALSRHAFKRVVSMDIETSFGKRRWLDDFTRMGRDLSDIEQEALLTPVHGLNESGAERLIKQLSQYVQSGDTKGVLEVYDQLREHKGMNWITQVSFTELENRGVLGSVTGSMHEGASYGFGAENIGRHAARGLGDSQFENVLLKLAQERRAQGIRGGALVGLNIDKFDMRVIRQQAWIQGEVYLERQKAITKALAEHHDSLNLAKRLQELGVQLPTGSNQSVFMHATKEAERYGRMAGIRLAYSGRFDAESGMWRPVDDAVVQAARSGMRLASDSPIADQLTVSDVTTLYRRFVTDTKSGKQAIAEAQGRVKLHIMGEAGKNGWVESTFEGVTPVRMRSQMAVIWGSYDSAQELGDTLSQRMKFVLSGIENENVFNETMARAAAAEGADSEALGLIDQWFKADDVSGIRGLDTRMEKRVHKSLDRLAKLWGEKKVDSTLNTIFGQPAGQESLLYTRKDVFHDLLRGLKTGDGDYFFEQIGHLAGRDTRVAGYMLDEVFRTSKRVRRFVGNVITKVPDDIARIMNTAGGVFGYAAGAQNEPGATLGARSMAYVSDLISFAGESLTQTEIESIPGRTRAASKTIAGLSDSFHNKSMTQTSERIAKELGEALNQAIDPKIVEKLARRSIGIGAIVAVGAGVIAAGTINHRNKQYDDIWEYGPTENESQSRVRRTTQSTNDMGRLATEMSTRRNYSFNMRNDKHDHLFRR